MNWDVSVILSNNLTISLTSRVYYSAKMATVPLGPDLLCQEYQFLHLETYCLASIWDRHKVSKDIKCWQCYFAAAWHSERPWWELWRPLGELSPALPGHQEPTRACSPTADPSETKCCWLSGPCSYLVCNGLLRRKLCASPHLLLFPWGWWGCTGPPAQPRSLPLLLVSWQSSQKSASSCPWSQLFIISPPFHDP